MIGAISHDLRTPLTRLRFRIEEVPDEQHAGLLGEIEEMEAMISSVIAFMRDASTPGARERRDLAELVGDVVEDAALLGDVRAVAVEPAPVDIDALGVRRMLDNLLTNAIKYGGGRARVALHVENALAVADIVDDGPGIAEAELERVFEPFYRSQSARDSEREGSGLGLAVCRSIARAHGGDVRLFRSQQGFTARITLPLAYDGERQLAA
jgi:signal transduction histidine kinase